MRTLMIGAVLAALAVPLAACGGGGSSAASAEAQKAEDTVAIDQIEKKWHQAASTKNLDEMMSLWAPGATFQAGPKTVSGLPALRKFFSTVGPYKAGNHWISDTPAYKIRTTINGDKGSIYFECHYVDVKTQKVVAVVAADSEVAKVDGKWLITHTNAASPTLTP